MKNYKNTIIPVVAAVILNKENKILLAQRNANMSRGLKWEFPGGKLRINETPEDCLKREIKEELGIKIKIRQLFDYVNYSYPDKNILLLAFLADFVFGEFVVTDHRQVKWVSMHELTNYELSSADVPIAQKLISSF
ncbi:MAG: 8-oxo-dGTP diphosphatase MutT [Promethearchaeota archaeon]